MAAPPYECRPAGRDGVFTESMRFKVYYVDICGRQDPGRYEWSKSGLDQSRVRSNLTARRLTGVGFVISFPHVTKVFFFDPKFETNLNVRAFRTEDFEDLALARDGECVEFGCLAEAIICGEEFKLWAEARNVADYLDTWVDWQSLTVRNPNKL